MKINKYLKELGLEWADLPGNYKKEYEEDPEMEGKPAADCRNEEDEEGFSEYEFFSLDYSFNLYIYSRLCYFREYISDIAIPGCFISNISGRDTEDQKKDSALWHKVLDEMIEGFKLSIVGDVSDSEVRYKITHSRRLLAEYWDCLWY